jgi:hypothetical protein
VATRKAKLFQIVTLSPGMLCIICHAGKCGAATRGRISDATLAWPGTPRRLIGFPRPGPRCFLFQPVRWGVVAPLGLIIRAKKLIARPDVGDRLQRCHGSGGAGLTYPLFQIARGFASVDRVPHKLFRVQSFACAKVCRHFTGEGVEMGLRGPKAKPPDAARAIARGYYRLSRHAPRPETPKDDDWIREAWAMLRLPDLPPTPLALDPIEELLQREGIEIRPEDRRPKPSAKP